MIEMTLRPFLIDDPVSDDSEDFDFEQVSTHSVHDFHQLKRDLVGPVFHHYRARWHRSPASDCRLLRLSVTPVIVDCTVRKHLAGHDELAFLT